jgi:hypothetical protein
MGIAEREVSSHPVTTHNGINIYTLTVLPNKEPRLTGPVSSDRYPLDGSYGVSVSLEVKRRTSMHLLRVDYSLSGHTLQNPSS